MPIILIHKSFLHSTFLLRTEIQTGKIFTWLLLWWYVLSDFCYLNCSCYGIYLGLFHFTLILLQICLIVTFNIVECMIEGKKADKKESGDMLSSLDGSSWVLLAFFFFALRFSYLYKLTMFIIKIFLSGLLKHI